MGKRQIKKNFNNKTIDETIVENKQQDVVNTFLKTLAGVAVVLTLIFLVLNNFMNTDTEDPSDYADNLGYNKILAQDTFDKPEDSYVVFFINGEEGKDEVNTYFEALGSGAVTDKIYVVDMAEQVNATHLVDDTETKKLYGDYGTVEYNKEPSNASELEIYNFPTVIKVSGGNFAAFYEGDEFYDGLGVTNPNAAQQQQQY